MKLWNVTLGGRHVTLGGRTQVAEVTGLTVRVINNVRKRMEVKPKFYDAFKGEGFPSEFSYNQKVLPCSRPLPRLLG